MRVLIIEDEEEIYSLIKKRLEEECFVVDVATDGKDGSYMARTNNFDIIILDNILPGKDGKQICKEIREAGKIVPILMLSVKSQIEIKVELLNLGADDYLSKPFLFEELLARIYALLRRPKIFLKPIANIEDLVIDFQGHSVMRNNKPIYLSRKEFMLLEFLFKNRGTVLSRGMIMEHVWDMNADPFSNTIESHILSLRKKIEKKGHRDIIVTVPGRGYKIDL